MRVLAASLVLVVLLLAAPAKTQDSAAEAIPLERCDRLPVVTVRLDGRDVRLLVDTAATSMLNLESFPSGRAKKFRVSSWSGTEALRAREVSVREFVLGGYRVSDLKLPAIDLSAIGKACGSRIDGILGIDLLEQMGATIDLKQRVARLPGEPLDASEANTLEGYLTHHRACVRALNSADGETLGDCFDPHVVLFTPWGEVRGRSEVIQYLHQRYFSLDPPAQFDFRNRHYRVMGNVVWFGYDYTIQMPEGPIKARGMGMCRKTEGGWRMVIMHNTLTPSGEPQQP
ncbi:MAG: nuclear transport factor 2 family protein [Terriglobia bacterium]